MNRRDFVWRLGMGLTAAWALNRFSWPLPAVAGGQAIHLALLADAHLKNGNPARPEAQALARAVTEIRGLRPAPDLVLFAGDLAHWGDPRALALGREILSDLPAPLLIVQGEGDGPTESGGAWKRLFKENRFSHAFRGITILGLHTDWQRTASGPAFALGQEQRRWLAKELSHLDPAAPLLILSHAPLAAIFRPWQQWTADADRLMPLLAQFRRVLFLHCHVHQAGVRDQGLGIRNFVCQTATGFSSTENFPLPPTAWPLPLPEQGTPRRLRPGLAPHGCGWGLLKGRGGSWEFSPCVWEA